ncbi:hypothetical protein [Ruminiclostridium josui]|uniref:hypothetical protein n=1 Tax=Ruminiclostridium josui TaxID=1499 RepID=UPI0006CF7D8A|nr:hypothetical protein [Ruminiclostridium josui]
MEYGRLVATRGVADEMESDPMFAREISAAFDRYQRNDWGDLCPEDSEQNDQAVKVGERVLAAYPTSRGTIWIITEWDRSVTTILFPSEY